MHEKLRVAVAILLVAVLAGCAQVSDDPFDQAFRALDQVVRTVMDEEGTPGLALAITSEDGLLYEGYYGFADLTRRTPVTDRTLFQIGSISKSFTALALMHLWDEGLFDPQRPVQDYLPWWSVRTEYAPITGYHLMTHTAGIPANRDDIPGGRSMVRALREQATAWPPGERFYYSNIGYQTLGVVLEEISGETYASVITRVILEPLGMNDTNAAIEIESRFAQATGYVVAYDDRPSHRSYPLVEAPFLEYWMGDGSIQSTARDMAAYARMLMRRGAGPTSRVVSEQAFDRIATAYTSETSDDGDTFGYGYGMGVSKIDGHHFLEHGGGMVGLYANLEIDLDDRVGIVALVNGPVRWKRIFDYARAALRAAQDGQEPPPLPESEDPAAVEDAEEFAETFTSETGSSLVFATDGNHLRLLNGDSPIMLERNGKDSFFTPHQDFNRYAFTFARDDAKSVVAVTHGPAWYTNERYSGPTDFETPQPWSAYTGRYRSYSPWFPYFEIFTRNGQLFAVIGMGSETGSGEIVLEPRGQATFHPGKEPSPEVLRFEDVVGGRALRATWSGHEFFRISN